VASSPHHPACDCAAIEFGCVQSCAADCRRLYHAPQTWGVVRPAAVATLTISSLTLNVEPGSLQATATGTVSGIPVRAELSSVVQPGTAGNQRLGVIRVTSTGVSLDALLFAQSSQVSSELGFGVPKPPAAAAGGLGYSTGGAVVSAEIVFQTGHGLRLMNISMTAPNKIGLSEMARRIGFSYSIPQNNPEPVLFSSAYMYYVPNRTGAPGLTWNGQQLRAEMGVVAFIDVPSLKLAGMRGSMLVQPGGKLVVEVRPAEGSAALRCACVQLELLECH
jgi:hypothetical protein